VIRNMAGTLIFMAQQTVRLGTFCISCIGDHILDACITASRIDRARLRYTT
jgi:hypothetical protein